MNRNPIASCLWFDGQAMAAAEFYCSVFKNSKITDHNAMVVTFELGETKMMGLNGGATFKFNPSISFSVSCATLSETNEIWDKLIEGGKPLMTIDKYAWSERYGWLQDKFGLSWQISVARSEGSKQKITPSLLFTDKLFGRAEAALNFYHSIFKNTSTKMMVHYPNGDANAGKVLYSEFEINQQEMIAMDGPGSHDYVFNEAVSFVVYCETQDEIDYYWNQLTQGGQESMCGWLKDKFGISWQIVPTDIIKLMTGDQKKAERVMQAVMQMKKLDLEKMMNA